MVPKEFTTEQKANRRDVCLDLLDHLERETEFFSRFITVDESWILEYDPETKRQSRNWHTAKSTHPKKARMIKSMLFFDRGSPQGICATRTNCQSKFLSGSPSKTQEKVARVRSGIARTWMLHHDNVPFHTAVSINEFLAEKSILVVPQPPYSPNHSSFVLFIPRLKNHVKGRHFSTLDNIQKNITDELKGIPAEAFQHCYEQWKQRLRRCVAAQGDYFEGDNLDL